MFRLELIVDIGAGNTVIYEKKRGLVLSEPSIVAVKRVNGRLRAVCAGNEALTLARSKDRDESVSFFFPINNASVENAEACRLMLKYFLEKLTNNSFVRPTLEITAVISCGLSGVERKALESIFLDINIKNVTLVEAPIAVLPSCDTGCRFVVVTGASVTDIAVVGENGIITGCSVSICGNALDKALKQYISENYSLNLSVANAEIARKELSELSPNHNKPFTVVGQNIVDGSKRNLEITCNDVRKVLIPAINDLITAIEAVMRLAPDTLQASIQKTGIYVYGGLANIHYLDEYIYNATGIKVELDGDITHVAVNCAKFFKNKIGLYKMLGVNLGGKK